MAVVGCVAVRSQLFSLLTCIFFVNAWIFGGGVVTIILGQGDCAYGFSYMQAIDIV